jgi:hypothetical protein
MRTLRFLPFSFFTLKAFTIAPIIYLFMSSRVYACYCKQVDTHFSAWSEMNGVWESREREKSRKIFMATSERKL